MYRTKYAITILSEDQIPGSADLADVIRAAYEGDYVAAEETRGPAEQLSGEAMAAALYAAGSEPAFFQLDDAGDRIDD